jgi:hypothetical protein
MENGEWRTYQNGEWRMENGELLRQKAKGKKKTDEK